MAYSFTDIPITGESQDFEVSFTLGYISKQDVYAYVLGDVDGNGNIIYRQFDWLDDNTIRLLDPLSVGEVLRIQRVVSKQNLVHDFTSDGSADRRNIETAYKQVLMIAHELFDGVLADKALVQALPQDIENGLKFVSENAAGLLAAGQIDSNTLTQLSDAYVEINVALEQAQQSESNAESSANAAQDAVQAAITSLTTLSAQIIPSANTPKFYGLFVDGDNLVMTVGIDNYSIDSYAFWHVTADAITFIVRDGNLILTTAVQE